MLGCLIIIIAVALLLSTRESRGKVRIINGTRTARRPCKDYRKYRSFQNIILSTPDGTTEIDRVLISSCGIFVIEEKDQKGWIFGGERQKRWTQSLYTRDAGFFRSYSSLKCQFQNPLHQNYKHLKALQRFLNVSDKCLFSVIVFTGDCEFKTPMPSNVLNENELSAHLAEHDQPILTAECVDRLCQKLADHSENSSVDLHDHIKNVEENLSHPKCPRCGKLMALRTARKGPAVGSQFWGCPNFPACKMTKSLMQ